MKITRRQLRSLIKEYEQYVDEDGNVWDDEGNVTRKGAAFGRQYGGGTYGLNAPWSGGRSRSRRKTSYVGASANSDQIAAVEKALAAKSNNFLSSILSQLKQGRGLSSKQKSIVKKIMAKASPDDVKLFESTVTTYDGWTDGDFVDAIRDYSKELTGRRDTYGGAEDLEALTMIELQDYYEEMFDGPDAVAFRQQRELEDQKFSDSEVGYEDEGHPLERSPLRQGMGRRTEGVLRVTRRQLREALAQAFQNKDQ